MRSLLFGSLVGLFCFPVYAEKIALSNNQLTFQDNTKQTIQVINLRPESNAYFKTTVHEVLNPELGAKSPLKEIKNPIKSGLLVTPSRSIIKAGERTKSITVLNTNSNLSHERVYRIDISPAISPPEVVSEAQLKLLVGYDVLVHVQPKNINFSYSIGSKPNGQHTITNNGNAHFEMRNGQACESKSKTNCTSLPDWFIYPGVTATLPRVDESKTFFSYTLTMKGQPFKQLELGLK